MKDNSKNIQNTGSPQNNLPLIIAALLWLFHLLPFLMPQSRLWGFNHLIFLPQQYLYIYLIAGILVLAIFLPPFRKGCANIYNSVAERLFEDRSYAAWIIFPVLMLIIFWLLRMPVNLLGDGYSVINNIGNDLPVQFKWSEAGAIKIVFWVSQLLPFEGLEKGKYAYMIVSTLSGAVTVFFFFLLAYQMGREKIERLLIFGLLLFSGWMLLFFGYSESYPILWPFMTGYLYFSVRYIKGNGSLILPTILLAAAMALHLQSIFFSASYLVLLFSRGFGLKLYRKNKYLLWSLLGIGFAAGVFVFIKKYEAVDFQQHFLPLITGRPATPGYAIFSPIHILDIINEITLLIPIWPILVLLSVKKWRTALKDSVDRFLLSFILGGSVFLIMIDPTLGMGRDWDLFAMSCLGPLLLLSKWAVTSGKGIQRNAPGMAAISLILTLPFFVVNIGYSTHLDYVNWQLRLDKLRSKTGHVLLRGYYTDIGSKRQADSIGAALKQNFPVTSMVDKVQAYLLQGQLHEALVLAEQIYRADPYSYEGYMLRGVARLHTGNFAGAIDDLEQAVRFAQWNSYPMIHLAQAYQSTGKYDQALKSLRRVQELNPALKQMQEGFAMTFNALGQYDSAYVYGERLILADPAGRPGYLVAGVAAYNIGKRNKARIYLNRFLEMNPPEFERARALEILDKLQ